MTDTFVTLPQNPSNKEALEMLLWKMIELDGSDIFIMGNSPVFCRVGPKLVRLTKTKLTDKSVFDLACIIQGEQARAQLGAGVRIDTSYDIKHAYEVDGVRHSELYRWRVNMVSCNRNARQSLTITMRAIPGMPPSADKFDIPQDIMDLILNTDQGLAVVVGPTGSGKTTLMAACLREKLTRPDSHRNLVTIEHPIEFIYDKLEMPNAFVTQMEVGRHVEGFSEGIENAMRMAPTDILLGEARSYETMSAAIQGALTGHFLLTTLHANSVAETFQRIKSLYPESLQHTAIPEAVQAMKLCVTQRLLPRVDGGRVAAREYLILDQEAKTRLARANNPVLEAIRLLESQGQPMIEDVQRLHERGLISSEELARQKNNYAAMKEAVA